MSVRAKGKNLMRVRGRSWCVTAVTLVLAGTAVVACKDDMERKPADLEKVSLQDTRVEPPGANCQYGGIAARTGLDDDDDGVLADSEVTATTYDCGAPVQRSAGAITTQAQADALADVDIITGNLIVDGGDVTSLTLPKLQRVHGGVTITDNASLTSIALAALTTVDGAFDVDGNGALATIDLGSLATVGGHCVVTAAAGTTSIDLGALASITGDFALNGGGSNAAVTLHPPSSVGQDMTIDGLKLTALAFDAGSTGGDLSISNNGVLTALTANGAVTVGGKVYVTNNPTLATAVASTFAASTSASAVNRIIKGNAP